MLLLLARLGLRAHEIIVLQLEDCRWDSGQLRVRSKSRREQCLPIPDDVGVAIATYSGDDPIVRIDIYFCDRGHRSAG